MNPLQVLYYAERNVNRLLLVWNDNVQAYQATVDKTEHTILEKDSEPLIFHLKLYLT